MRSENWRPVGQNAPKEQRAIPVFRFKRGANMHPSRKVLPFTELPEELKPGRFSFVRLLRAFLNFLLMLILSLALLVLVLVVAYQIMHNPETLGAWASGLMTSVEQLILSFLAALK